jgi:hypothetical protein
MPKHALSYRVQAKILFRKEEEEEEDFASILNLILFVKKKKNNVPSILLFRSYHRAMLPSRISGHL